MRIIDLLPAFNFAVELWQAQENQPGAPDVASGGLLDAANELEWAILKIAANVPASTPDDMAAKLALAELAGAIALGFGDDELTMTAELRRSIEADQARLAA